MANITTSKRLEIVAVAYVEKVAGVEMIEVLAKTIRKQSRAIAEQIVNRMDINVFIRKYPKKSKDTLALKVSRKIT